MSAASFLKLPNKELEQGQGRRERQRLSHFSNHFSTILSHNAPKYILTILELNWYQLFGDGGRKKIKINRQVLTSSTNLQNRSLLVVDRTRTATKCTKMKKARAKHAKVLLCNVKYANC